MVVVPDWRPWESSREPPPHRVPTVLLVCAPTAGVGSRAQVEPACATGVDPLVTTRRGRPERTDPSSGRTTHPSPKRVRFNSHLCHTGGAVEGDDGVLAGPPSTSADPTARSSPALTVALNSVGLFCAVSANGHPGLWDNRRGRTRPLRIPSLRDRPRGPRVVLPTFCDRVCRRSSWCVREVSVLSVLCGLPVDESSGLHGDPAGTTPRANLLTHIYFLLLQSLSYNVKNEGIQPKVSTPSKQ